MNENLPFVRSRGQARCEATSLVVMAETLSYLDRPAASVEYAIAAADVAPRAADAYLMVEDLRWYAVAASRLGEAERSPRSSAPARRPKPSWTVPSSHTKSPPETSSLLRSAPS